MAEKSKLWYLENFNLFENLNKKDMAELNKLVVDSEKARNEPVYFESDPSQKIFFLKTGRVKIIKYLPDGSEKIISIINPGEVFGEMAFLDEKERSDFAVTVEPARICAINKNDLSAFIEKNPSFEY